MVYSDADGEPHFNERLSVPRFIDPGTHTDLKVDLEEDVEIENNELLWVVLHTDDGDKVFEYNADDDLDLPILTENDEMVMDSFRISFSWPTGSLIVSNQVIEEDRIVIISSVDMLDNGWLVLHGETDGNALLAETIAEPVYLEAGSYENVELTLKESLDIGYSEVIYAFLHSDDGDKIYEYDGTGAVDAPFLELDATPVVESFIVYTASSVKYFLLFIYPNSDADISAIPVFDNEPGWLVVYRDNGLGAPAMSEMVSVPKFLAAEEGFSHLSFESGVEISGQEILWVVFHSDDGDGAFEYEEDNNIDPLAEDENGEEIRQSFLLDELTFF